VPIYEYNCSFCDKIIEIVQPIKEPHLEYCPKCGEKSLERLISMPAVVDMGPKTIGRLAEKNRSKFGHYEKEKKDQELKDHHNKAKKIAVERGTAMKGGKVLDRRKKEDR